MPADARLNIIGVVAADRHLALVVSRALVSAAVLLPGPTDAVGTRRVVPFDAAAPALVGAVSTRPADARRVPDPHQAAAEAVTVRAAFGRYLGDLRSAARRPQHWYHAWIVFE
jgi:hypothetical protein